MNNETLDVLIVGQGLAGSLLAWSLAQRGCVLKVVDAGWRDSASLVAAGLVNPVTGKRLVLQEDAEDCLTQAEDTYHALSSALGTTFFHPMPQLRLFVDHDQRDYYHRRRQESAQNGFWGNEATAEDLAPFDAPWGGAWQNRTGYLDTAALLTGIRQWLAENDALIEHGFDYEALDIVGGEIRWHDVRARNLVFCEGFGALRNPWLRSLPFQPAKGEILALDWQAPPALGGFIIHKGIWLAPRADDHWRLGATNTWDPLDTRPTEAGVEGLMNQLNVLMPGIEARVIDHKAGVRPGTRDRMPFLGRLPGQPQLAVFNGFGAKGSLLIPRYARLMTDYLCDGSALPPQADIRRYG